jgi:hypothetical protein
MREHFSISWTGRFARIWIRTSTGGRKGYLSGVVREREEDWFLPIGG